MYIVAQVGGSQIILSKLINYYESNWQRMQDTLCQWYSNFKSIDTSELYRKYGPVIADAWQPVLSVFEEVTGPNAKVIVFESCGKTYIEPLEQPSTQETAELLKDQQCSIEESMELITLHGFYPEECLRSFRHAIESCSSDARLGYDQTLQTAVTSFFEVYNLADLYPGSHGAKQFQIEMIEDIADCALSLCSVSSIALVARIVNYVTAIKNERASPRPDKLLSLIVSLARTKKAAYCVSSEEHLDLNSHNLEEKVLRLVRHNDTIMSVKVFNKVIQEKSLMKATWRIIQKVVPGWLYDSLRTGFEWLKQPDACLRFALLSASNKSCFEGLKFCNHINPIDASRFVKGAYQLDIQSNGPYRNTYGRKCRYSDLDYPTERDVSVRTLCTYDDL